MFYPRCDGVKIKAFEGRGLYAISENTRGATALDLATRMYGENPRNTQKCTAHGIMSTLLKHRLVSVHYAPRTPSGGTRGSRWVAVYSVTKLGQNWLQHHPESSAPHRPKAPKKCKSVIARPALTPQSASLSTPPLARYIYRPLPLRVRRAHGIPAHVWR